MGVPHPRSRRGGLPYPRSRGYPIPGPGRRGVPHPADGWEYPIPGAGGGTPSQVQVGGYPIPGPGGGYPIQLMDGGYPIPGPVGGTLSQVQVGVPHPADGWGSPQPSSQWGGALYPLSKIGWDTPIQDWMGYPPPRQETDQQSEHMLRSGRYASCVHTGGLSCYFVQ